MWDKLLALLKDPNAEDENYIAPSIAKRDARRQQLANQQVPQEAQQEINSSDAKQGTLIGYNYLKGMDDNENNERARRFINLQRLLSGKYQNGKIEATTRESEQDLRREDSE